VHPVHEDKTRLIEFGRFAEENRRRKSTARPEVFGFSGNSRALGRFRFQVMKAWRRVLPRRSQRPKLSWERFNALLKVFPLPFGRVHRWRQQMA
jgi:hypothetical protein